MMSIDTAPMMEALWPSRLRLILDNQQFFTPQERERIGAYVVTNWRPAATSAGLPRSFVRRWTSSLSAISCVTSRMPSRN